MKYICKILKDINVFFFFCCLICINYKHFKYWWQMEISVKYMFLNPRPFITNIYLQKSDQLR